MLSRVGRKPIAALLAAVLACETACPVSAEARRTPLPVPPSFVCPVPFPLLASPIVETTPAPLKALIAAIPQDKVLIREISAPKAEKDPVPPLILIQDVHRNPEAQSHIAATIETLIQRRQISLVAAEGAFGPLSFDAFRRLADRKSRRDLAKAFADKNLIGAVSMAGVSLDHAPPFIGVDDRGHYKANVAAYLATLTSKRDAATRLRDMAGDLEREKQAIFSPELQRFDALREDYHSGRLKFGAYVKRLCDGSVDNFAMESFLAAYDMENSLGFDRVEHERNRVVDKLSGTLKGSDVSTLLERSLAYRSGQIGFGDYYRYLKNLCEKNDVNLRETPAFDDYIRYVLLSDGIKADELFAAVGETEESVLKRLVRTPEQKALADKLEWRRLAEKLIEFKLTPDEWKKYKTLVHRPNLSPFERFYVEADIRSHLMIKNLAKQSSIGNCKSTILVVGGFHTSQITAILKKDHVPYIVLSPKLTKISADSGDSYLAEFSREKTPLEKMFSGTGLFVQDEKIMIGAPGAADPAAMAYALLSQALRATTYPVRVTTSLTGRLFTAWVDTKDSKETALEVNVAGRRLCLTADAPRVIARVAVVLAVYFLLYYWLLPLVFAGLPVMPAIGASTGEPVSTAKAVALAVSGGAGWLLHLACNVYLWLGAAVVVGDSVRRALSWWRGAEAPGLPFLHWWGVRHVHHALMALYGFGMADFHRLFKIYHGDDVSDLSATERLFRLLSRVPMVQLALMPLFAAWIGLLKRLRLKLLSGLSGSVVSLFVTRHFNFIDAGWGEVAIQMLEQGWHAGAVASAFIDLFSLAAIANSLALALVMTCVTRLHRAWTGRAPPRQTFVREWLASVVGIHFVGFEIATFTWISNAQSTLHWFVMLIEGKHGVLGAGDEFLTRVTAPFRDHPPAIVEPGEFEHHAMNPLLAAAPAPRGDPVTVVQVEGEVGRRLKIGDELVRNLPGVAVQFTGPYKDASTIATYHGARMAEIIKPLLPADGAGLDPDTQQDLIDFAKDPSGPSLRDQGEAMKKAGVRVIRLYGLDHADDKALAQMSRITKWLFETHGIRFVAGLHNPTNFDAHRIAVALKGNPGLLMYDLGNEWNRLSPAKRAHNPTVADMDTRAGVIRAIDNRHPVSFTFSHEFISDLAMVADVKKMKHIQVLGVNIYPPGEFNPAELKTVPADRAGPSVVQSLRTIQREFPDLAVMLGETGSKKTHTDRSVRMKSLATSLVEQPAGKGSPSVINFFFEWVGEEWKKYETPGQDDDLWTIAEDKNALNAVTASFQKYKDVRKTKDAKFKEIKGGDRVDLTKVAFDRPPERIETDVPTKWEKNGAIQWRNITGTRSGIAADGARLTETFRRIVENNKPTDAYVKTSVHRVTPLEESFHTFESHRRHPTQGWIPTIEKIAIKTRDMKSFFIVEERVAVRGADGQLSLSPQGDTTFEVRKYHQTSLHSIFGRFGIPQSRRWRTLYETYRGEYLYARTDPETKITTVFDVPRARQRFVPNGAEYPLADYKWAEGTEVAGIQISRGVSGLKKIADYLINERTSIDKRNVRRLDRTTVVRVDLETSSTRTEIFERAPAGYRDLNGVLKPLRLDTKIITDVRGGRAVARTREKIWYEDEIATIPESLRQLALQSARKPSPQNERMKEFGRTVYFESPDGRLSEHAREAVNLGPSLQFDSKQPWLLDVAGAVASVRRDYLRARDGRTYTRTSKEFYRDDVLMASHDDEKGELRMRREKADIRFAVGQPDRNERGWDIYAFDPRTGQTGRLQSYTADVARVADELADTRGLAEGVRTAYRVYEPRPAFRWPFLGDVPSESFEWKKTAFVDAAGVALADTRFDPRFVTDRKKVLNANFYGKAGDASFEEARHRFFNLVTERTMVEFDRSKRVSTGTVLTRAVPKNRAEVVDLGPHVQDSTELRVAKLRLSAPSVDVFEVEKRWNLGETSVMFFDSLHGDEPVAACEGEQFRALRVPTYKRDLPEAEKNDPHLSPYGPLTVVKSSTWVLDGRKRGGIDNGSSAGAAVGSKIFRSELLPTHDLSGFQLALMKNGFFRLAGSLSSNVRIYKNESLVLPSLPALINPLETPLNTTVSVYKGPLEVVKFNDERRRAELTFYNEWKDTEGRTYDYKNGSLRDLLSLSMRLDETEISAGGRLLVNRFVVNVPLRLPFIEGRAADGAVERQKTIVFDEPDDANAVPLERAVPGGFLQPLRRLLNREPLSGFEWYRKSKEEALRWFTGYERPTDVSRKTVVSAQRITDALAAIRAGRSNEARAILTRGSDTYAIQDAHFSDFKWLPGAYCRFALGTPVVTKSTLKAPENRWIPGSESRLVDLLLKPAQAGRPSDFLALTLRSAEGDFEPAVNKAAWEAAHPKLTLETKLTSHRFEGVDKNGAKKVIIYGDTHGATFDEKRENFRAKSGFYSFLLDPKDWKDGDITGPAGIAPRTLATVIDARGETRLELAKDARLTPEGVLYLTQGGYDRAPIPFPEGADLLDKFEFLRRQSDTPRFRLDAPTRVGFQIKTARGALYAIGSDVPRKAIADDGFPRDADDAESITFQIYAGPETDVFLWDETTPVKAHKHAFERGKFNPVSYGYGTLAAVFDNLKIVTRGSGAKLLHYDRHDRQPGEANIEVMYDNIGRLVGDGSIGDPLDPKYVVTWYNDFSVPFETVGYTAGKPPERLTRFKVNVLHRADERGRELRYVVILKLDPGATWFGRTFYADAASGQEIGAKVLENGVPAYEREYTPKSAFVAIDKPHKASRSQRDVMLSSLVGKIPAARRTLIPGGAEVDAFEKLIAEAKERAVNVPPSRDGYEDAIESPDPRWGRFLALNGWFFVGLLVLTLAPMALWFALAWFVKPINLNTASMEELEQIFSTTDATKILELRLEHHFFRNVDDIRMDVSPEVFEKTRHKLLVCYADGRTWPERVTRICQWMVGLKPEREHGLSRDEIKDRPSLVAPLRPYIENLTNPHTVPFLSDADVNRIIDEIVAPLSVRDNMVDARRLREKILASLLREAYWVHVGQHRRHAIDLKPEARASLREEMRRAYIDAGFDPANPDTKFDPDAFDNRAWIDARLQRLATSPPPETVSYAPRYGDSIGDGAIYLAQDGHWFGVDAYRYTLEKAIVPRYIPFFNVNPVFQRWFRRWIEGILADNRLSAREKRETIALQMERHRKFWFRLIRNQLIHFENMQDPRTLGWAYGDRTNRKWKTMHRWKDLSAGVLYMNGESDTEPSGRLPASVVEKFGREKLSIAQDRFRALLERVGNGHYDTPEFNGIKDRVGSGDDKIIDDLLENDVRPLVDGVRRAYGMPVVWSERDLAWVIPGVIGFDYTFLRMPIQVFKIVVWNYDKFFRSPALMRGIFLLSAATLLVDLRFFAWLDSVVGVSYASVAFVLPGARWALRPAREAEYQGKTYLKQWRASLFWIYLAWLTCQFAIFMSYWVWSHVAFMPIPYQLTFFGFLPPQSRIFFIALSLFPLLLMNLLTFNGFFHWFGSLVRMHLGRSLRYAQARSVEEACKLLKELLDIPATRRKMVRRIKRLAIAWHNDFRIGTQTRKNLIKVCDDILDPETKELPALIASLLRIVSKLETNDARREFVDWVNKPFRFDMPSDPRLLHSVRGATFLVKGYGEVPFFDADTLLNKVPANGVETQYGLVATTYPDRWALIIERMKEDHLLKKEGSIDNERVLLNLRKNPMTILNKAEFSKKAWEYIEEQANTFLQSGLKNALTARAMGEAAWMDHLENILDENPEITLTEEQKTEWVQARVQVVLDMESTGNKLLPFLRNFAPEPEVLAAIDELEKEITLGEWPLTIGNRITIDRLIDGARDKKTRGAIEDLIRFVSVAAPVESRARLGDWVSRTRRCFSRSLNEYMHLIKNGMPFPNEQEGIKLGIQNVTHDSILKFLKTLNANRVTLLHGGKDNHSVVHPAPAKYGQMIPSQLYTLENQFLEDWDMLHHQGEMFGAVNAVFELYLEPKNIGNVYSQRIYTAPRSGFAQANATMEVGFIRTMLPILNVIGTILAYGKFTRKSDIIEERGELLEDDTSGEDAMGGKRALSRGDAEIRFTAYHSISKALGAVWPGMMTPWLKWCAQSSGNSSIMNVTTIEFYWSPYIHWTEKIATLFASFFHYLKKPWVVTATIFVTICYYHFDLNPWFGLPLSLWVNSMLLAQAITIGAFIPMWEDDGLFTGFGKYAAIMFRTLFVVATLMIVIYGDTATKGLMLLARYILTGDKGGALKRIPWSNLYVLASQSIIMGVWLGLLILGFSSFDPVKFFVWLPTICTVVFGFIMGAFLSNTHRGRFFSIRHRIRTAIEIIGAVGMAILDSANRLPQLLFPLTLFGGFFLMTYTPFGSYGFCLGFLSVIAYTQMKAHRTRLWRFHSLSRLVGWDQRVYRAGVQAMINADKSGLAGDPGTPRDELQTYLGWRTDTGAQGLWNALSSMMDVPVRIANVDGKDQKVIEGDVGVGKVFGETPSLEHLRRVREHTKQIENELEARALVAFVQKLQKSSALTDRKAVATELKKLLASKPVTLDISTIDGNGAVPAFDDYVFGVPRRYVNRLREKFPEARILPRLPLVGTRKKKVILRRSFEKQA